MTSRLLTVGIGILFAMAVAIIASGYQTSSSKGSAGSRPTSKTLQDLSDQVSQLNARIRLFETEQDELRGRLARLERPQFSTDLSGPASELARFDCTDDQNKAWALALSQRVPGYTLEGAAAMNCTQRLAKITEKAVLSISSH